MKWLNRLFGGPKDMAALPAGTKAPDFTLPDVSSGKDGGSFSLQAALQNGPVLARSSRFPVLLPVHVPVSGTHPPSARGHENHDRRHLAGQPARHCRFPQGVRSYFSHAARRSEWLRGLKRLRADQCPEFVPDRAGWPNRSQQRGMGKAGGRGHPPQARFLAANSASSTF